MTEDLTGPSGTFDLIGAIEGTTFPEITTPFFFDAEAANLVHGLNKRLSLLSTLGRVEEYEALEPVFEAALEDLKSATYKVTVRGIPRKIQKAIVAKAQKSFPDHKPKDGFQEPNIEGFAYHQVLQWQAQIVKIEDPQGRVNTGTFEESVIQQLLDNAPQASLSAVAEAIEELETGPKAGYEVAVRNLDFSQALSPEDKPGDSPAASE